MNTLLRIKSGRGNITDSQLLGREIANRERPALIADTDGCSFGHCRKPGSIQPGALREML